MKGYYTNFGYMGYLLSEGKYRLFATSQEYFEYYMEFEELA